MSVASGDLEPLLPHAQLREPYRRRLYSRYPVAIRRLVVYQAEILGLKTVDICFYLDMTERSVQRILQFWRKIGEDVFDPKNRGQPRLMTPEEMAFLIGILRHSPDLYLDECAEELYYMHGIDPGLSTISETLKWLGWSSKTLSKRAAEKKEVKILNYIMEVGVEEPQRLVFADETTVNLLTTQRRRGRAKKGQRAYSTSNFARGERFSILPALSMDGILFCSMMRGSFDGLRFLDFIDGVLDHMNPWPAPNSVLVIDNCRIHHVDGVKQRCDARGVKLIYLPPYSPEYNPIEETFSTFKAFIRRHGQYLRRLMKQKEWSSLCLFFLEALHHVATDEHIRGWFRRYQQV